MANNLFEGSPYTEVQQKSNRSPTEIHSIQFIEDYIYNIKLQQYFKKVFRKYCQKVSKILLQFMNQTEIKQGYIRKPFESKVASKELRDRVEKFQKLLQEKHFKSKKRSIYVSRK